MNKLLKDYDQSAVKLAEAAFNLVMGFRRARASEPKQIPKSGLLHHYTTAEGFQGIIEKNELWATSAYFLNDSAEITYGYGVLKEALDGWINKRLPSEDSLTLGLARALRRFFGEDLLNKVVIQQIYLACFCEDDNLLSQWRAYGQSGGYSLGFTIPAADLLTGQGFKPEPTVYTSPWAKVEYDRTTQLKKCSDILDALLPIFDDSATHQALITIGDHPLFGYQVVLRAITELLSEEIVSFKDKAFEVEKEWRVVVRRREYLKQGVDDGGRTPIPVYFRASRGMLVPYIKLIPTEPTKKLPIASVRSGPMLDKMNAGLSLSMLLDRNGFSNIRVHSSGITTRFQ